MSSPSSPRSACGSPDTQPLPPKPWSGRGRPRSLLRRQPARAGFCQGTGVSPARRRLARGLQGAARLTLCRHPRAAGASRLLALRTTSGGMVPDRVAARRGRADQVLALDLAGKYRARRSRRPGQTEMADRTGLSGAQALKQEIGLGPYEGRGWRGFHHHATLAIAAYGFLVSERSLIPPSAPRLAPLLKPPALSEGYRPRGAAAPSRTPRQQFNPLGWPGRFMKRSSIARPASAMWRGSADWPRSIRPWRSPGADATRTPSSTTGKRRTPRAGRPESATDQRCLGQGGAMRCSSYSLPASPNR